MKTHIEIKITSGSDITYRTFTKDRKGAVASERFLSGVRESRLNCEYELVLTGYEQANSKRWALDKVVTKMLNKLSDLERQVKVANDSVTKYTDLLKGDQVKKVVQRLKCTDQLNKSLDRHSLHTAKHKEYSAKCDAKIEELNACKNLANKRKAILDGIPKPPIIRIEINHITKDSDYDKDLL